MMLLFHKDVAAQVLTIAERIEVQQAAFRMFEAEVAIGELSTARRANKGSGAP